MKTDAIKGLSVLIIDDEYGRDTDLQEHLMRMAGVHGRVEIVFCSGQSEKNGKRYNDFGIIKKVVAERKWSLVLLDLNFADDDGDSIIPFGAEACRALKVGTPDLPLVMLTGERSQDLPEIIRGSVPYLSKESLSWRNLVIHGFFLGKSPSSNHSLTIPQKRALLELQPSEIAVSNVMLQTYFDVFRLADPTATRDECPNITLIGETGCGKEELARYYHRISCGENDPYITLNINSIPETLFESEMFGHKKDSFNGAKDKQGLVTAAGNGTLFLDEIGALDIDSQTKLLRLVENREYRRVGDNTVLKATCRFVFATNDNIADTASFRGDMFYRLGIMIEVPRLCDHKDDLDDLVHHFLKRRGKKLDVAHNALERLKQYNFPGNVRELREIVDRFSAMKGANDEITVDDVEAVLLGRKSGSEPQTILAVQQSSSVVPTQSRNSETSDLMSLADLLDAIKLHENDTALKGGILKIEAAYDQLVKRMYKTALSREGDLTNAVRYLLGKDELCQNILPGDCKRLVEAVRDKGRIKLFNNIKYKSNGSEV